MHSDDTWEPMRRSASSTHDWKKLGLTAKLNKGREGTIAKNVTIDYLAHHKTYMEPLLS